jgi:hypothetical protein
VGNSVAWEGKRCCGEGWNGAQGRNRTTDTVIFSHVLYQLSYLGAAGICRSHWAYRRAVIRLSSGRLGQTRDSKVRLTADN